MSRLFRALAFTLAAIACISKAEASQCRHVDRLILGEDHTGLPSFWADRTVPAWEQATPAKRTAAAISCHDPATAQPFTAIVFQPIVEWRSSQTSANDCSTPLNFNNISRWMVQA
ncbi:MAG: hypothetical protein ACKO85_11405, partial [Isosphaeraceae bacterium]